MSFEKYSMTIFQKSCTIFSEALTTISHPTKRSHGHSCDHVSTEGKKKSDNASNMLILSTLDNNQ